MALLIAIALRLVPIGAILLLRQGVVSGWVLVVAIAVTVGMVLVNMYADDLRGAYAANEFNPEVGT